MREVREVREVHGVALAQASARAQLSKSKLVRRAVIAYLVPGREAGAAEPPTALALAGDLVGCFAGGSADLASNPRCPDDFGRR